MALTPLSVLFVQIINYMKLNNRKIYIGIALLLFAIGFTYFLVSFNKEIRADNSQLYQNINTDVAGQRVDKIQIFYFHRSQRCNTCKTIGRLTEEVISERFADELERGVVEFKEVNVELLENKELAKKFKATGPSLYINTIKNGYDDINQDVNVWRLINNEAAYKDYLENKIKALF